MTMQIGERFGILEDAVPLACNKPVDEEEMMGSGEPKKKLKGYDCFITQCKFKGRRHEDYLRHIAS